MTKQEFETLTGKQITESQFEKIHEMYMSVGDNIDKQTFCKNYKDIATNPLFNMVVINYNNLKQAYKEETKRLQSNIDEMLETNWNVVENLTMIENDLRNDYNVDSDDYANRIKEEACQLVGKQQVTIHKVESGYKLDEDDSEIILEALNHYRINQ